MDQQQFLAILVALVALPAISSATEHVVGGDRGWTLDYNYTAWADGQQFLVGDKLVFNYFKGDHNVCKVDEAGFQQCTFPAGVVPLESGNDVVTLDTPGKKWYICGVPEHCSAANQKLAITVLSSSPSATPPPAGGQGTGSANCLVAAGVHVVSVVAMIAMVF